MIRSIILGAAALALPASAMAAPYVESKTTAAGELTDGGTYKGAQTELRVGYEQAVGNGVKLYGEVGPGYEWNNGGTNEYVTVGEIGVAAPLAEKVSLKAKVTSEYGGRSEVFDLGGEVKIRYSF
jgi:hypothetical protein